MALTVAAMPLFAAAAEAETPASAPASGEAIARLPPRDALEKAVEDHAYVGPYYVIAPVRRALLVRNGESRCAIRFLSWSRDHDEKATTAFVSGSETLHASAEFWTPGLSAPKPLQLTRGSTFGFARMIVIAPYHDTFRCGRARLHWLYPTGVFLGDDDHVTQLAWTSLDDFAKVDVDDPALVWVSVDRTRPLRVVTLP